MHRQVSIAFPLTLSLLVAFVLTIIPLPTALHWWRPAWVLIVLVYWTLVKPKRVSLTLAWLTGVLVDLLAGAVLGMHALIFSLSVFFLKRSRHGWDSQPAWVRGLAVLSVLFASTCLQYLVMWCMGQAPVTLSFWFSFLASVIVWPFGYVLLSMLHHRKR